MLNIKPHHWIMTTPELGNKVVIYEKADAEYFKEMDGRSVESFFSKRSVIHYQLALKEIIGLCGNSSDTAHIQEIAEDALNDNFHNRRLELNKQTLEANVHDNMLNFFTQMKEDTPPKSTLAFMEIPTVDGLWLNSCPELKKLLENKRESEGRNPTSGFPWDSTDYDLVLSFYEKQEGPSDGN